MQYLKFGIILFFVALLFGCSFIRKLDGHDEHKNAPSYSNPIAVPDDMSADEIEEHYRVPKIDDTVRSDVSVLPPVVDHKWK